MVERHRIRHDRRALLPKRQRGRQHVPTDALVRYQRRLTRVRNQLRQAMRERVHA